MPLKVYRVHVEVSEIAFRKLIAEARRRARREGRGKPKIPIWKIVEDLLLTLPDPETAEEIDKEPLYATR